MAKVHQHWIGGRPTKPEDGQYFRDLNPVDDSLYAEAALGTEADVAAAVETAQAAFCQHRRSTPSDREAWLLRTAEMLHEQADTFVEILIDEIGSPIVKAEQEVVTAVRFLKAAAGATRQLTGKTLTTDVHGRMSFSIRQPLGVVAAITPFNVPLIKGIKQTAMALATGNSVVMLPSEEAPVLAVKIAELYADAGIPEGLLNVVTGRGDDIGDVLTSHSLVKMVSFTGSTRIGRHIGGLCGKLGKRFTLEMGGKNPLIVLKDADVDRAVQAATLGSFLYQGQICMASSRIYVEQPHYKEFLEKFVGAASRLGIGALRDRSTLIGPIINQRQRDRVKSHVKDAVDAGAKVLTGGEWTGNCCHPTIFSGVTDDMTLFRVETFGPVTAVFEVDSAEEALARANDSDYGLCVSVFTSDLNNAMQFAEELQTGMVHVNGGTIQEEPQVPFGGAGNSGFGREGTDLGIDELMEWKWVTIQRC